MAPIFIFFSRCVGDRACCAGTEIQDLSNEGGERAAVGRATGTDQTEDQARAKSQGPAG